MGLFSAAALTSLFDFLCLGVVSPCVFSAMYETSKRVVYSGTGS